MNYNLQHANIMDWLRDYDGPQFHAILTDPPYHLTSITKRFGKPDAAPAKGGVYNRTAKGFMGTTWDGGDLAFQPELWAALGEKLHPGGFLMSFASSRGWHRVACAIEDAGFVIHPTIFGWGFGSGFPKATRIDTQVDKAAGAEGIPGDYQPNGKNSVYGNNMGGGTTTQQYTPATPLAQAWAGHRYGLQALKPALEPIIVAQKPYEGRPIDCITSTGAGALNIDGGRIGTEEIKNANLPRNGGLWNSEGVNSQRHNGNGTSHPAGRWPSNLILMDDEAAAALDRMSGESGNGKEVRLSRKRKGFMLSGSENNIREADSPDQYGDSGGASRFFYRVQQRLDEADPVYYEAKASRTERDKALGEELPLKQYSHDGRDKSIENPYQRNESVARNPHPTVKPIDLTRYLATLLLPPAEYAPRRILIPFCGVGSEMIGAMLVGWDEVIGVEMSEEYIPITRARLEWWSQWPGWGQAEVEKILKAKAEPNQLGLW